MAFDKAQHRSVTPLHKAAVKGILEVVKLLAAKLDDTVIQQKDASGYTAADLAQHAGHTEIAVLLRARHDDGTDEGGSGSGGASSSSK